MVGAGFEPAKAEPTGLQPVPFDRSGTPPATPASLVSQRIGYRADAVTGLTMVEVGRHGPERFESVLSADQYERLRLGVERAGEVFSDRVVWHVNSTARGGGVA